ncbi:hypothetical protein BH10BAC2_BH10BAC2_39940 [soil metagenome]
MLLEFIQKHLLQSLYCISLNSYSTVTSVIRFFKYPLLKLGIKKDYPKNCIHFRKMQLQHRQEILATQLEIQRQTMQHIGREMHDNVGQKLTLAALYIQQLDTDNKNEGTQKKISSVASIINDSLADLRSLSKSLTDTENLHTDLYELINNECVNINATGSCIVILQSNTKRMQVSQAVKNFVLRILQEFLQNSLKHSGCTEISVQLEETPIGLNINVADNGKAFTNHESFYTGIGIKNMKKRSEIIGADLAIESKLNEGTKMHLFIPANKLNL